MSVVRKVEVAEPEPLASVSLKPLVSKTVPVIRLSLNVATHATDDGVIFVMDRLSVKSPTLIIAIARNLPANYRSPLTWADR